MMGPFELLELSRERQKELIEWRQEQSLIARLPKPRRLHFALPQLFNRSRAANRRLAHS